MEEQILQLLAAKSRQGASDPQLRGLAAALTKLANGQAIDAVDSSYVSAGATLAAQVPQLKALLLGQGFVL